MSIIQVVLVDTTCKVNPELVQAAASALNLQVMRDLPQFWNVQASGQYLPHASMIPANVWPVQLVKSLPPGEGGFHLDKHNQPYAKVIVAPDDDSWTIDASHETIEMLIDPSTATECSRQGRNRDCRRRGAGWHRAVQLFGGRLRSLRGEQLRLYRTGRRRLHSITPRYYDPACYNRARATASPGR